MASQPLTFYSHRFGPNPWKTTTVLYELNIPHTTVFLDFGSGGNGVEGAGFKEKNPAGRVPLIYDPNTGISLAESNAIALYLTSAYDPSARLSISDTPEKHLITQWLFFQGASQGAIVQKAVVLGMQGDSPAAVAHLQSVIKRSLKTVDDHLAGKTYLVGEKCTIADLAFVNWDHEGVLDRAMKGDGEAATMAQREKLYPSWAAWHERLLGREAVGKMLKAQKKAVAEV